MNWGVVALGAMVGLGGGLVAFLVLGLIGIVGPEKSPLPLIFLQFLTLFAAGYVAGRFSVASAPLHGGWAALLLFLIVGAISVAAAPGEIGIPELILLGVVATVLGTAGGALAMWQKPQ